VITKRSPILSARIKKYWRILGPGLITGASDDDPSGIATYSQAGAGFGFATLWTAIITFPLMAAVQEMCARIGMVTQEGLTATLKKKYSKSILYLMAVFSFPAITLNIGADIQAMGSVALFTYSSNSSVCFQRHEHGSTYFLYYQISISKTCGCIKMALPFVIIVCCSSVLGA
jgi:Mn2+/Fe2+ NRAMP family transporter